MGQKVNPIGIRLGIVKDWTGKWYADKTNFSDYLVADIRARQYLRQKLKSAFVSRIDIQRPAKNAKIIIHSARPGMIIGRKGGDVDLLSADLAKIMKVPVHITIQEIRKPEMDAALVAANVAQQLERRAMFRRVMKRTMQSVMRQGAQGVKIALSGRLGGAEIARREWAKEGRIPLHTFRADIDYATAEAETTYGIIGIKIWIFKGEVHHKKAKAISKEADAPLNDDE